MKTASAPYIIMEFDFGTNPYIIPGYCAQQPSITPKKTAQAANQFINNRIAIFASALGYNDYKFVVTEQYADSSKHVQNLEAGDIVYRINQAGYTVRAEFRSFPIDNLKFIDVQAITRHSLRKEVLIHRFLIKRT